MTRTNIRILPDKGSVRYFPYGKPESQKVAYPLVIGGANPPDQGGKEGVANVCYIRWLNSAFNIQCCPCWSCLRNFRG